MLATSEILIGSGNASGGGGGGGENKGVESRGGEKAAKATRIVLLMKRFEEVLLIGRGEKTKGCNHAFGM